MSTKNLLKNNRVFLTNNENSNTGFVTCRVTRDWGETSGRLYVNDTSDFAPKGVITCMDGYSRYRYSSKGNNYFNISLPDNKIPCRTIVYRAGSYVKQELTTVNNPFNLSGWYVDGTTRQATLKVSESPVSIPGAIRFIPSSNTTVNGRFQGCVKVSDTQTEWVDFNATKGPAGRDGNINTTLKYNHIGSNEGQIIKTTSLNVNTDTLTNTSQNIINDTLNIVEVRSIAAGRRVINNQEKATITVNTTTDNVKINTKPSEELVHDLTENVDTIKGNPDTDQVLNCYGEQIRIRVAPNSIIHKGQIVTITQYTDTTTNKKYYGVKPLTLSNKTELLKYQLSQSTMKYCFGLSRQDGTVGDIINILVNGIGLLRIGNNVETLNTISTTNVKYIGHPVLMDMNGYGFVCQDIAKLPDPHMELGHVLEQGSALCKTGNYIIIRFNPQIIDL